MQHVKMFRIQKLRERPRVAFTHVYKTAGTTFLDLLRRHYGIGHVDRFRVRNRALTPRELGKILLVNPALQSIGGHPVRPTKKVCEMFPNLRFYIFFRDPVARTVSHYCWFLSWKAHVGIQYGDLETVFRKWCASPLNQNRHCHHLSTSVTSDESLETLSKRNMLVLRADLFFESLLLFRNWAGEPGMNLDFTPKNTKTLAQKRIEHEAPEYIEKINLFSQQLKAGRFHDLIVESNREDLKIYQHVVEKLWPAQSIKYPGSLREDADALREQLRHDLKISSESLLARGYRNLIFKPALRLILETNEEPLAYQKSEWY